MIMTRRTALRAWCLPAVALVVGLVVATPVAAQAEQPRNVILLIADGCGPASFTMARTALARPLALDPILLGSAATHAADTLVTDSAAAATALASGHKTRNGRVGVDVGSRPLATLLEAAEERGLWTGLVTTTWLTHATPASFAAHVPDRYQNNDIAVQLLAHQIEVLLGGGAQHFLPESRGGARRDGRDLIEEAGRRGVTTVRDPQGLQGPLELPVLGLFASGHLDYEIDRDPRSQPSLAEMTERALQLLSASEQGFFLMVEGGRIDHAGHENDPIAHLHDIEAFDATVERALAFARAQGDTLVLSTSDHETGGLSLSADVDGEALNDWRPAVLNACRSSAGAIAERLISGDDVLLVFSQEARIGDLTDDELDLLSDDVGFFSESRSRAATVAAVCAVINRRAGLSWATTGHTAVDVPVFAYGPGAAGFSGHHDNTELCDRLAMLLDVDLAELTTRLRAGETPWLR